MGGASSTRIHRGAYYRGKHTSVKNLGSKRGGSLFSKGCIFKRVQYNMIISLDFIFTNTVKVAVSTM